MVFGESIGDASVDRAGVRARVHRLLDPPDVLVGHGVDGEVEGELAAVFGGNTAADVAAILHAEGTAQSVLAHGADQSAFVKQAFEVNIDVAMQTANTFDPIERTVERVIVRNHLGLGAGKQPRHLTSPSLRKLWIGAAA